MSGIGIQSVASLLPDDIEARLAEAQLAISKMNEQISSLQKCIDDKTNEQQIVAKKLVDTTEELNRVTALFESKKKEMSDKEESLNTKEAALTVYANALGDKEKKINKYLNIFDRMKDVVGK